MNQAFWSDKRVLLTGHTGFKGAWLTLWLQRLGAKVTGVSLAAEEPSLFRTLEPWRDLDHYEHDIRDADGLATIVRDAKPDIVLHLAAQALVRVGYADPVGTFETNVMGTVNLLDAVRRYPSAEAVLIVTTDKVYRPNATSAHREDDPLGGLEPYAASKSCAELATTAWIASYAKNGGPAIVTARAGNVIGGGDWAADRLVPDIVRAFSAGQPVRIRNPQAIRPWQFVLEPLQGYLMYVEALCSGDRKPPPALNFGPDKSVMASVAEVIAAAQTLWGSDQSWISDEGEHPSETAILTLDSDLAGKSLGWRGHLDLKQSLGQTLDWYRRHREAKDMRALSIEQIEAYAEKSRRV